MLAKLKLKFETEEMAKEAYPVVEQFLTIFGDCGTLYENAELEGNTVYSEGIPIVDLSGKSEMFDELHLALLSGYLISHLSGLVFFGELKLSDAAFSETTSYVHCKNDSYAARIHLHETEDEESILVYVLDDKDSIADDESSPILYEDANDFVYDYYFNFYNVDLSFFKDDEFTKLLPKVDMAGLEEDFKNFYETSLKGL